MTSDVSINLTGIAGFVVALFLIFLALRSDNAKRFDRYTRRLEERVSALETKLNLSERRRYQLEAILRAAGLSIPPWPDPENDNPEHGGVLIPNPRSAS